MSRPQTQLSRTTQPKSARTRFASHESELCKFPFSDGRRCRMLRHPAHPNLCPFHARTDLQLRESASLGTELSTTISGDFMTNTDINHVLGKLYTAVAQDRVPARNAANLAYIGQLLLQSVAGLKTEFKFAYSYEEWKRMDNEAQPLSSPPALSAPSVNTSSESKTVSSPQQPDTTASAEPTPTSVPEAVAPDERQGEGPGESNPAHTPRTDL